MPVEVVEREAAGEAGQLGHDLPSPVGKIDERELPGARFEEPEPAVVQARGVRHRQAAHQDLPG